tara:strand:- start:137 stop:1675 length:1539 start_codon:yes stop_codon:yes gene_type:complete
MTVKITLLSHACLLVETPDVKFVTDPWIVGSAFAGGWWNTKQPPANWKTIINNVDFIYMSHNHNDHLNEFTLKYINKDMKFIVPDFKTKSVERPLNNLGFKNIVPIKPKKTHVEKDCVFNIYQSGDGRDDSGLLMGYKGFKFLTSVDSVNLNKGNLPKKVTVYASSFAGGSSGFPLMFERMKQTPILIEDEVKKNKEKEKNKTYLEALKKKKAKFESEKKRVDEDNERRKESILLQNLQQLKSEVKKTIYNTKAQFYLPYAGFYKVNNDYVTANDILLQPTDYKYKGLSFSDDGVYEEEPHEYYKYQLLDTSQFDSFEFKVASPVNLNYQVRERVIDRVEQKYETKELPEMFYANRFPKTKLPIIKNYFVNSKFQHNLILYLTLCEQNNDFKYVPDYHVIDFRHKKTTFTSFRLPHRSHEYFEKFYDKLMTETANQNKNIKKWNRDNPKKKPIEEMRVLKLRIKLGSLLYVIKNQRPLEDIITGYQCVVDREPNDFKVDKDFWYHFSNIYTG